MFTSITDHAKMAQQMIIDSLKFIPNYQPPTTSSKNNEVIQLNMPLIDKPHSPIDNPTYSTFELDEPIINEPIINEPIIEPIINNSTDIIDDSTISTNYMLIAGIGIGFIILIIMFKK